MFRRYDNDRGIALLTVMTVMTVLVITGSLLLRMASSESRIIYSYGNNIRAFYVAEAGADLAIRQWNTYINNLTADPDVIDNNNNQIIFAQTDVFYSQLNGPPRTLLEERFRTEYSLGSGSSKVGIEISNPGAGALNMTVDTPELLTLDITGTYDDSAFEQRVQLWYYYDKTTGSYKGYGAANVPVKPLPPPGGGGDPPPYHPPISSGDWTVLTGGGAGQWTFDPITGTISRTPESIHVFLYSNNPVSVPFSLDMYVSFFNLHRDWKKWIGSSAGVGFGYDPLGIPHYSAYFSIIDGSNSPRVMVNIFDQNLMPAGGPYIFSRSMDGDSQYRLKLTAKTDDLKIEVSNGGETFTYATATTLRTGNILLIDLTNSHADPKFTFPP